MLVIPMLEAPQAELRCAWVGHMLGLQPSALTGPFLHLLPHVLLCRPACVHATQDRLCVAGVTCCILCWHQKLHGLLPG